MKNILILIIILFSSCATSQKYDIKYNDAEPSEKQKLVIQEIKKENEIMLFFDGGFDNESMTIIVNDEILHQDVISTDNIIGSAKSYTFLDSHKEIRIKLKEHTIKLTPNKNYPFISIDIKNNTPFIEYRKTYKKYK